MHDLGWYGCGLHPWYSSTDWNPRSAAVEEQTRLIWTDEPAWITMSLRLVYSFNNQTYMEVSWNRGTPKSSIYRGFLRYKPSIIGYPYVWKPPYILTCTCILFREAGDPVASPFSSRQSIRVKKPQCRSWPGGSRGRLLDPCIEVG